MASDSKPTEMDYRLISGLRSGADLDPQSIHALANAISHQFARIAELWGGKKFFRSAAVSLPSQSHDETVVWLEFTRKGGRWDFIVVTTESRNIYSERLNEVPIFKASLAFKQLAVDALPRLSDELTMVSNLQKETLLNAFDEASDFAAQACKVNADA